MYIIPKNSVVKETKVVTVSYSITHYQGGNLLSHIRSIASQRPTGKLTINFINGGIQSLEWHPKGNRQESTNGGNGHQG